MSTLAIDGGKPVRSEPFPERGLIGPEEKAAAVAVFDEAIETGIAFNYNGKYEKKYEEDFAEMMGGGFADGVNSGTSAVYTALGALQLDALSEVITAPTTDPGGAMPVALLCCVPVIADADPRTFNTSAEQIEPMITERTKAIIVAHIGGDPVDMDPIMDLSRSRGLYVIEDCAQAHMAKYKDRTVGTMGDFAVFSTMSGKHHCTGSQGGVVFTRDEELYWRAKRFADRGKPFNIDSIPREYYHGVAGLNCNLNDLAAAIGIVQLEKLPGIIEGRRKIGESIKDGLNNSKAVSVGWQVPDSESVYWFLRIKLEQEALVVDKTRFCQALVAEGITPVRDSYRHFPGESPWFRNKIVFGRSGFPWNCSDYKGPKEPQANIANALNVDGAHFSIDIHESCGDKESRDILEALEKVEKAYSR